MKTKNKAEEHNSPVIDEIFTQISPGELNRTRQRMLLAARIAEAIKAKNWKKTDFARAMKKSPSEITKWLSGTHNFTSDTLWDISEVLGIRLINIGAITGPSYKYQLMTIPMQISLSQENEVKYSSGFLLPKSRRLGSSEKYFMTQKTDAN